MLAAWVVVAIIVHMLVVCVAIGELVREFKRANDLEAERHALWLRRHRSETVPTNRIEDL
jgi:hypothetical protein